MSTNKITDEEISRMLEEDFGLPKEIPLTHKVIHWDQLTHEQIVAEIELMLVDDFEVSKDVPLTFLKEIKWKNFTPAQINSEIYRILKDIDFQEDQVEPGVMGEIFNPKGNLTGSPLFEGQKVEVYSEYNKYCGIISYLFLDDASFTLEIEECDLEDFMLFVVNEVTVTSISDLPADLIVRGNEATSRVIEDPIPSRNIYAGHTLTEDVDFLAQGNLTASALFVGQRIIVESARGRFIGRVGNLQNRADSAPVAIRNGAIRLWPDATPNTSKAFIIEQVTITSE